MCSRCFAGRCQTALPAVASTASPTGLLKSSAKPATLGHTESGQRLAANADQPEVIDAEKGGDPGDFIAIDPSDPTKTIVVKALTNSDRRGPPLKYFWRVPLATVPAH